MKKLLFKLRNSFGQILLLFLFLNTLSINAEIGLSNKSNEPKNGEVKPHELNRRVSFIIGIGASYSPQTSYQDPSINNSNNNVIIEKSQGLRTNLSLGIQYTPRIFKVTDISGDEQYGSKGPTFATFISPLSLSKISNSQTTFNMVDFGIGIGYKTIGGFSVMGVVEWIGVRQPKTWFINEFKTNDKQYLVNGAPQISINENDLSIFRNKIFTSVGFKVCYTFDIVKDFQKSKEPSPNNTKPGS